MTTKEIADILVHSGNFRRSQAIQAVHTVFEAMWESLVNGEDVHIRNFATFKTYRTKEKKARDIKKGTGIVIPPRYTVKLVLCDELKKKLNE